MGPIPDILISHTDEQTTIALQGRLDAHGASTLWNDLVKQNQARFKKSIQIDLNGIDYLDTAGAVTLSHIRQHLSRTGRADFQNIRPEHEKILAALIKKTDDSDVEADGQSPSFIEQTGVNTYKVLSDTKEFITYIGQITWSGVLSLKHPSKIRWSDTLAVAERAGVNALPIVALISFIVGLVMAFQAAIPMRMFGAELYVANLIGIAMVRELGPLMTAIVLAGRSGSAFAAEIGTMRINEEIDALSVMGLDPVRFLIIPRVIAATLVTPLLAIFSNLMGIIGGALVITSLGYPIVSYINQIAGFVKWNDLVGGLIKCFVFGLLIAVTGCIRGYQTAGGPSAVGTSTTRAVVTSIILIAVFDGIFSIIYFYLGV